MLPSNPKTVWGCCIILLHYYIIRCNYLFDSCNCNFGVLLTRADWAHCVHHKKTTDINQYLHRFHELLLFYTQKMLVRGRFDGRWTALVCFGLKSRVLLSLACSLTPSYNIHTDTQTEICVH